MAIEKNVRPFPFASKLPAHHHRHHHQHHDWRTKLSCVRFAIEPKLGPVSGSASPATEAAVLPPVHHHHRHLPARGVFPTFGFA